MTKRRRVIVKQVELDYVKTTVGPLTKPCFSRLRLFALSASEGWTAELLASVVNTFQTEVTAGDDRCVYDFYYPWSSLSLQIGGGEN